MIIYYSSYLALDRSCHRDRVRMHVHVLTPQPGLTPLVLNTLCKVLLTSGSRTFSEELEGSSELEDGLHAQP